MNKLLIITCLSLFGNSLTSQENIKLIYNTSTDKSILELEQLTRNDKLEYKKAIIKYNELEQNGKIILSSEEYKPIKMIIDNYQNGVSLNQEEIIFAEKALKKYISITEILSK